MKRFFYAIFLLMIGGGVGYYGHEQFHSVLPYSPPLNLISKEERFKEISLSCLTETVINSTRENGSIDQAFSICKDDLHKLIGSDFGLLDDDALKAIFSTIVAAQFAEYGNSSALTYEKIRDSEYLNCGNTVLLTGYLYGIDKTNLRSIGFDGGEIGNHAQLYYQDNTELLLDPTTGLVAKVSFDDLLRGIPVPKNKIRMFAVKTNTINSFRDKVFLAVLHGKYRPSDFMYMHESISKHLIKGSSDNYFTPGGIYIRNILKKNQTATTDWKEK